MSEVNPLLFTSQNPHIASSTMPCTPLHVKDNTPRMWRTTLISGRFLSVFVCSLQVKYKINQNQVIEGSMDLPNLLQLKHALHASKLQSNVNVSLSLIQIRTSSNPPREPPNMHCAGFWSSPALTNTCPLSIQIEYKKKYEQSKGHYHIALDTAEQLHHRENAVLHSQVGIVRDSSRCGLYYHGVYWNNVSTLRVKTSKWAWGGTA